MLLYSRQRVLSGSARTTSPWAVELTEFLKERTGMNLALWVATFGYPLGTMVWSAAIESQAALEVASSKLIGDNDYADLLDRGDAMLLQPPRNELRRVVFGGPQGGDQEPPLDSVATVTTATAVADRMGDAVAWAVDLAEYVMGVTGNPLTVATNVYGPMADIMWLGVAPDVAAAESAGNRLDADADYMQRLASGKDLFLPGTAHRGQAVKIA